MSEFKNGDFVRCIRDDPHGIYDIKLSAGATYCVRSVETTFEEVRLAPEVLNDPSWCPNRFVRWEPRVGDYVDFGEGEHWYVTGVEDGKAQVVNEASNGMTTRIQTRCLKPVLGKAPHQGHAEPALAADTTSAVTREPDCGKAHAGCPVDAEAEFWARSADYWKKQNSPPPFEQQKPQPSEDELELAKWSEGDMRGFVAGHAPVIARLGDVNLLRSSILEFWKWQRDEPGGANGRGRTVQEAIRHR